MKIIVANWKMNGSISLVNQFVKELNEVKCDNRIIICPPAALVAPMCAARAFVNTSSTSQAQPAYVSEDGDSINACAASTGAQDCFYEESGAFTGEHSPKLLKELGCDYVLLGHSERRTLFHESDEIIYKKWNAAIKQSLCPIVCVGEKLEERDNWQDIISKQLKNYFNQRDVGSDDNETYDSSEYNIGNTIFAYEPIWSIGTGLVPSIEEIENVLNFIRTSVTALAAHATVLYGGSVTSKNAAAILSSDSVDGVLVGGASLKIEEFKAIVTAV
ncbi:triosephosphate isomerase [Alphaproteobacteria bacterium]|nr:triosephosphate isomerase [Alphaproteobacteria bacterium]